jgi:two-component sensor histidine kinase
MTTLGIDAGEVLDALSTPALVVGADGKVAYANRATQNFTGRTLRGANLYEFNAPEPLGRFLARCAGTTGPLVGALTLPVAGGDRKSLRCHGSRLRSPGETRVLLRCANADEDRFALLTRQVSTLNDEVRRHKRTQAVLEETLRERELLVREVHHRVKNNIQILLGMLQSAARESKSQEVQQQLGEAARRLSAMAAVQHALYHGDRPTGSRADYFLGVLVAQLRETWVEPLELDFAADPIELPDEVTSPLALIVNELLTNSIKYARQPGTPTRVNLRLARRDGMIELCVEDNGPGFVSSAAGKRSSGLGLVRGLTRQLRGRFHIDSGPGARCVIRFPDADTGGSMQN